MKKSRGGWQSLPCVKHVISRASRRLLTYDPNKRAKTLAERVLDFSDALIIFKGAIYEFENKRADYQEKRMIAVGHLAGRMIIVGYVARGHAVHVFSMKKANERDVKKYQEQFEEGGCAYH